MQKTLAAKLQRHNKAGRKRICRKKVGKVRTHPEWQLIVLLFAAAPGTKRQSITSRSPLKTYYRRLSIHATPPGWRYGLSCHPKKPVKACALVNRKVRLLPLTKLPQSASRRPGSS